MLFLQAAPLGLLLRVGSAGRSSAGENGDDGDHHEQFDQSKGVAPETAPETGDRGGPKGLCEHGLTINASEIRQTKIRPLKRLEWRRWFTLVANPKSAGMINHHVAMLL